MPSILLSLLPLTLVTSLATVTAQPKQTNITLGSSLTVGATPNSWSSPSGRFAFGFYPKADGFAIGIWLATTPKITILWTAARDDPPITEGSIRLTFDSRIVWSAPGGQGKTIAQASEPASMAAMLDSGNLVLYNAKQQIIWSSFASPTDTIVPGQSLLPGNQLYSSAADTDRSTGKFRLNNQKDGNLVLYPIGTTDTANDAYWDSGTFQNGFLLTLDLGSDGLLYLTGDDGNFTKNIAKAKKSGVEVFYRATVDVDGIFRLYSHALSGSSTTTTVEWEALKNRCFVRGVCGLNSYCVLVNGEPNCRCPPGFDPVDAGCAKNSTGDGCIATSQTVTMATMQNTTWVDNAYLILPSPTSAEDCKAACLADCFCAAAMLKDGQCSKQMLPLKYGRLGSNDTLFIKVEHQSSEQQTREEKKNRNVYILAVASALAAFSVAAIAFSGFLICKQRRAGGYRRTLLQLESLDDETPVRSYSYEELESATEGFREELGRGAFGTVFKGSLSNGGKAIAVKRLEKMVEDGEREFQREVRAIGRTHHRNLVRLLGFCNEGSNRLLVYDYMSNGSLANLLFKAERYPDWAERMRIALDVARGLQYLHEEIETHIIHCDIKPQNILMDESMTAKISDFGLAKLLMPDQTRTFTGIRGTRGYLAPEWHKNAPITVKADVYSYGVVLLEIICCRRSLEMEEAGRDSSLSEWAYECFEAGEVERLLGDEAVERGQLERVVKVALWCLQNEPVFRPSMKNVILMLEGNLKVSLPPPPASIS